jgi:hypothetical protein
MPRLAKPGIDEFLNGQVALALRDLRARRAWLLLGSPASACVLSSFLTLLVGARFGPLILPSLLPAAAVFGLGLGYLMGLIGRQRLEWALTAARRQVEHSLIQGGLLQLVLEHQPYERLPSLRYGPRALLAKKERFVAGSSMRERLLLAIENYSSICRDLELPVPTGSHSLLRTVVRRELAAVLRSDGLGIGLAKAEYRRQRRTRRRARRRAQRQSA